MQLRKPTKTARERRKALQDRAPTDGSAQSAEQDRKNEKEAALPSQNQAPARHGDGQDTTAANPSNQPNPKAQDSQEDEPVVLPIHAMTPAPGTSAIFDALCKKHTPEKALLMILRKALSQFETELIEGSYKGQSKSYETTNLLVRTSKTMSAKATANAQKYFDPFGLETRRALGGKIATTALAIFFEKEAAA